MPTPRLLPWLYGRGGRYLAQRSGLDFDDYERRLVAGAGGRRRVANAISTQGPAVIATLGVGGIALSAWGRAASPPWGLMLSALSGLAFGLALGVVLIPGAWAFVGRSTSVTRHPSRHPEMFAVPEQCLWAIGVGMAGVSVLLR